MRFAVLFLFSCLSCLLPAAPPNVVFILADNPGETKNLADANPAKPRDLRTRCDALAAQTAPAQRAARAKDFAVPAVWGEPAKDAK